MLLDLLEVAIWLEVVDNDRSKCSASVLEISCEENIRSTVDSFAEADANSPSNFKTVFIKSVFSFWSSISAFCTNCFNSSFWLLFTIGLLFITTDSALFTFSAAAAASFNDDEDVSALAFVVFKVASTIDLLCKKIPINKSNIRGEVYVVASIATNCFSRTSANCGQLTRNFNCACFFWCSLG